MSADSVRKAVLNARLLLERIQRTADVLADPGAWIPGNRCRARSGLIVPHDHQEAAYFPLSGALRRWAALPDDPAAGLNLATRVLYGDTPSSEQTLERWERAMRPTHHQVICLLIMTEAAAADHLADQLALLVALHEAAMIGGDS